MPVKYQQMNKHAGVLLNEPMSNHTSWRVGGNADRFFAPADKQALVDFLQTLPDDEALLWIGLGSNLLIRDGGIRGTVISLGDMAHRIQRRERAEVYVSAAIPCAKLARKTSAWGLGGAEFMAGIPGTIGGALAMNAGAFGAETWQIVKQVEVIDRQGAVRLEQAELFKPGYRHIELPPDNWFIGAYIQLVHDDSTAIKQRLRSLLKQRARTQPLGWRSCGSVFKNPPGDHAARLIEACGLKGHCMGGACVSDKHANFIINTGQASAADIEQLMGHVQAVVNQRFNIALIPEVKVTGEAITPHADR